MKNFTNFRPNGRKIEFAHFYTRVIDIVESYQPEILKFSTAYNEAKVALLEAEGLKIQSRKAPQTKEQQALSLKLDMAINVLLRNTVVKIRQGKEVRPDVNSFHEMIETYLHGYSSKNLYQKMGTVNKMLTVIKSDAELTAMAEAEELSLVIEKISDVYNELETMYKSRRKLISNKEKLKTEEIKRNLYFNLHKLFSSIEMAKLANPELNYDALTNELNQEILRFNAGSKPHGKKVVNEESNTDNTDNVSPEKVA